MFTKYKRNYFQRIVPTLQYNMVGRYLFNNNILFFCLLRLSSLAGVPHVYKRDILLLLFPCSIRFLRTQSFRICMVILL